MLQTSSVRKHPRSRTEGLSADLHASCITDHFQLLQLESTDMGGESSFASWMLMVGVQLGEAAGLINLRSRHRNALKTLGISPSPMVVCAFVLQLGAAGGRRAVCAVVFSCLIRY